MRRVVGFSLLVRSLLVVRQAWHHPPQASTSWPIAMTPSGLNGRCWSWYLLPIMVNPYVVSSDVPHEGPTSLPHLPHSWPAVTGP